MEHRCSPHFLCPVVALAGFLLLAATLLKLYAGPVEGWGLPVHLLLVHGEVALGCWLLSGWFPRLASAVACVCFAVFAIYSGSKAIAGHHSCGCFGHFAVNPWITASVDVVLAVGLGLSVRFASVVTSERWRVVRPVISGLIGVAVLAVAWWPHAAGKDADSELSALGIVSGSLVVLEPERWVNQRFHLASQVQDGERLMEGEWVVLLHQHGCGTCEAAIPTYRESMAKLISGGVRLALIEVSPSGESRHSGDDVWTSHLKTGHEWFATTPVVVHVKNAEVVQVQAGHDAADGVAVLSDWGIVGG